MTIILFLAESCVKQVLVPPKMNIIRPLDFFLVYFEKYHFCYLTFCRNTAETQVDQLDFLLCFCRKQNNKNDIFQSRVEKKCKGRMMFILDGNKTYFTQLSAKKGIMVIRPNIIFLIAQVTTPLYDAQLRLQSTFQEAPYKMAPFLNFGTVEKSNFQVEDS